MINWIKNLISRIGQKIANMGENHPEPLSDKLKREIKYRKRLKELKKKDPFIYK
tara:strand:+ start:252 stop:413 length:162 start_codon:yes stop_codon:yes gene_type:complete